MDGGDLSIGMHQNKGMQLNFPPPYQLSLWIFSWEVWCLIRYMLLYMVILIISPMIENIKRYKMDRLFI